MQFILDHLTSLLVAGVVILILATAQLYAQRSGLEQTTSYATKSKALSFGEWLEDDILSLGANYGEDAYRFEVPTTDSTTGNTTEFRFYSDSLLVSGDTLRMMTRYKLDPLETIVRGGREILLFEMERATAQKPVVNGEAAEPAEHEWTADGRSLSTLSAFNIAILTRTGAETTDVDQGEFIRVSFALVPEYPVEPEYLRELYWTTTLKVRPFWEPPSA